MFDLSIRKNPSVLLLFSLLLLLFLSACSSDSKSTASTPPASPTAYFIDSPVEGLVYETQSQKGVTESQGLFTYALSDSNITFKVGEILLGTIDVAAIAEDRKLFIQDLIGVSREDINNSKVLKIATLLQSLNSQESSDSITLKEEDLAHFTLAQNIEDVNLTAALALVGKSVLPVEDVIEHLGDSIRVNGIALYNYTPQVYDLNISTFKNSITNANFPATDGNDNFLEYKIESNTSHGSIELIQNSNTFRYTPDLDYIGVDSFTFRAYDGEKYSKIATINITVKELSSVTSDTTAPTPPTIVSIDATDNGLTLFWLNATDETTPLSEIRYEVHLSKDTNFSMDATTLQQSVVNTLEADITGLTPDTLYYIKVRALDNANNESVSSESSMRTSALAATLAPNITLKQASDLHLENAKEENSTLIFEDSQRADVPERGDILVGNSSDAYLKKVVSVDKNDTVTKIVVEDVAISEVVDSAKLSSKVLLFGTADAATLPSNSVRRSVRYTTDYKKESTTVWESGRFSVSNVESLSYRALKRVLSKTNSGFQTTLVQDNIVVQQNETLQIDIEALMEASGVDDAWKFKLGAIKFLSLTHPSKSSTDNFGAWYATSTLKSDEVRGYLKWTPTKKEISTEPYIARFEVYAEDTECSDLLDLCDSATEIMEARITVIGDGTVDTGGQIKSSFNSSVEFTNDVTLDFTPELIIEHEISGSDLNYAKVALKGTLDFNVLSKFAYTAAATKQYESTLVNKTYTSVYMAGAVPIYQEVTFSVDAELEAVADGSITAVSDLQTSFEIEAGVEYDGATWNPLTSNEFTKDYTATIETAGGVKVNVRLIPNIEVKFYKVASSGLSVEPWLEGDLQASATALLNTDFTTTSVLGVHKVEQLDLNVGIEAKVYADLTIWKYNLAHYPSAENDANGDGKKTIYNPSLNVFSIPSITLSGNGADICTETLQLNAAITNPESLIPNNFLTDTIEWVVFPNSGATIVPNSTNTTEATFYFSANDNYTIYMVGNSEKLGSYYGKQYESFTVDTRGCEIDVEESNSPFVEGTSVSLTSLENTLDVFSIKLKDPTTPLLYRAVDSELFNVYSDEFGFKFTFKTPPDYESNATIVSSFYAQDAQGNRSYIEVTITIEDVPETEPLLVPAGDLDFNGVVYSTVVSPFTGRLWLDRNLGASEVCTGSDDSLCFGDFFQQGRRSDGHEKRNSEITSTLLEMDISESPNFVINSEANGPWYNYPWREEFENLINDGRDNDLIIYGYIADIEASFRIWRDSLKNNVCPSGFIVPSREDFLAEFPTPFSSSHFLKLPKTDLRSGVDGSYQAYTDFHYWASDAMMLLDSDNNVTAYSGLPINVGLPVRCVSNTYAPVAYAQQLEIDDNATLSILLESTYEGSGELSYSVTPPLHGSLSGTPPNVIYTPNTQEYFDTDSFSYSVSSGEYISTSVDINITISKVSGSMVHLGSAYDTVVSPTTGRVWLDRNLGAKRVCLSLDDAECLGDYYQWGREKDGHEKVTSSPTSTQATSLDAAGSSFITTNNDYEDDWANSVDTNGTLRQNIWSSVDGSSVCPLGYRVPTADELALEIVGGREENFNNFLRVPSSGVRDSYDWFASPVGQTGGMWASDVNGTKSMSLYFNVAESYIHTADKRANGMNVRCIAGE